MDKIITYFYTSYGRYITKYRALPLEIDCLKFVQRRLLLSLYEKASTKFYKSATVVGHAMGTYHPHGDLGTYDALSKLVRSGYATGQGNWGSRGLSGYDPPAAPRYTEVKLSKWVKDLAFKYIKYVPWIEGELPNDEPLALPCPLPVGLIGPDCITGISFHSTLIPRYKLSDLATRLYYILTVSQENLYNIDQNDINQNIDLTENKYGPCITPNIYGCSTYDINNVNYYKLLTEGEGNISIMPEGNITPPYINIMGCNPITTFNSLKKAIDDKKLPIRRLIDHSGGQDDDTRFDIHVVVEANFKKEEKLKELFREIWINYLKSSISFRCIFSDREGKAIVRSIDWLLLNNYYYYREAVKNKRINDCIVLIKKKFNTIVIKIIRNIIEQNNFKTVNDIINAFCQLSIPQVILEKYENEQWIPYNVAITQDDIEKICSTKSIQRLIEVDTDTQKIDNEIQFAKQHLINTLTDCIKHVQELI